MLISAGGRRTVTAGELASPNKFVAGLRWGDLMPAIWAGALGVGSAFNSVLVDTIRRVGDAWASRAIWENSTLIHKRLGGPWW
jgi:hypothetical protein